MSRYQTNAQKSRALAAHFGEDGVNVVRIEPMSVNDVLGSIVFTEEKMKLLR